MPELPEVETVRRTLAPDLIGRRIEYATVASPDVVGRPPGDPAGFAAAVEGRRVEALGRRGKYLLLRLSGGVVMVVHLRMTGRLWICPAGAPAELHTHARLALDDGRELRFRDVRRFGRLYLYHVSELGALLDEAGLEGAPHAAAAAGGGLPVAGPLEPPGLFELGPEPFDPSCEESLARALARRRAPVKALLLDQRVIAGLGNIYADEALHAAGIHPRTPAGLLTTGDAGRLCAAAREVLRRAIDNRGTTLRDYVDGRGVPGEMRSYLRVYGREGEPCLACGEPVRRERVAGRSSFYCPRCQPPPRP